MTAGIHEHGSYSELRVGELIERSLTTIKLAFLRPTRSEPASSGFFYFEARSMHLVRVYVYYTQYQFDLCGSSDSFLAEPAVNRDSSAG